MSNITIASRIMAMTMTSREIAELTGKEHAHVMRDIRAMLSELELVEGGYLQNWIHPQNGQTYQEFALNRELTDTLLTGYSITARNRVIKRWHELEEQVANPAVILPDFTNPAIAARAWADQVEKVQFLEVKAVDQQKQLEVAQPKAAALDRIATLGNGSYCIREAAKMLNVQEKRLRQKLQEIHWIYHPPIGGNWLGYAGAREKGYIDHKRTEGEKLDGTRWESVQVRITDKGLAKIATLLQTEMAAA